MLELSLTVACLVVYLESSTLLATLDEALRLKLALRASGGTGDSTSLALGASLPSFRARIAGSSRMVTERDLLGKSTVLLFLDVLDARSAPPVTILATIASMWHKVDGGVNIVCRGSESDCLDLMHSLHLESGQQDQVRFLLDPDGDIRSSLEIIRSPSALLIDEHGHLQRHGAAVVWPGKNENGIGFLTKAASGLS